MPIYDYVELAVKNACENQTTSSIHILSNCIPTPSTRMIRSLIIPPKPYTLRNGAKLLEIVSGASLPYAYISALSFDQAGHPSMYWIPPTLYSYVQRNLVEVARLIRLEGVEPNSTWLAAALRTFSEDEEKGKHYDLSLYGEIPISIAIIVRRSAAGVFSTKSARRAAGEA